jgi:hypothetical protein
MQSDDRSARALAALSRPRMMFESALTDAVAELRALIAAQRAPAGERASQESVRLGEFAAGRLDASRFSEFVAAGSTLDAARLDRLQHALEVLELFGAQRDELYHVRVDDGADLRDSVRDALTSRGRVFSAAHQVELLRANRQPAQAPTHRRVDGPVAYRQWSQAPAEGTGLLAFRQWTRLEKSIAPPLVVDVDGRDVEAAGLSEYLQGSQKIVLVVRGASAPAPLVRLIAPGTFVMQTVDAAAVERLAACTGPGIAAVMPDGAARFVHDPAAGATLGRRLQVEWLPDAVARGGSARERHIEELDWLRELAALGAATGREESAVDEATAAPADQLAGWLLSLGAEQAS